MKKRRRSQFQQAIHEAREHLQDNGSPEADDEEALDLLMSECGKTRDGVCMLGGSEYCEWECPFRDEGT